MMPARQLEPLLCHLRSVADPEADREPSDEQLLNRYVVGHDGEAFAALVRRYGRLVRAVCRRVLRHDQDADDAFQATFLVFADRAGSIRKAGSVPSWLYGVAFRTAMNAKRARKRRGEEQRDCAGRAEEQPVTQAALREVQAILDDEVNRLPERQRAAFVLCCLEGKSRTEAARQLGWKEGTVSSNLARARRELQKRLARRGVALSAALCTVEISRAAANGPITTSLVKGTINAGLSFARGESPLADLVSAEVATLTRGALKSMLTTRPILATFLLAVVLLVAGIGYRLSAIGPRSEEDRGRATTGPTTESRPPRADRYGDPLPAGALHRLGTERFRRAEYYTAALSPDGKTLVASSESGLSLFDVETGKTLSHRRDLEMAPGHGGDRCCVDFSPDGKSIAGVGLDWKVHVWDTATGKEVSCTPVNVRTNRAFLTVLDHSVRFVDGGKALLISPGSMSRDRTAFLKDPRSGKLIREIQLIGPVVALSQDRRTLVAIGSVNKAEVALHDTLSGKLLHRFTGEGALCLAAVSPDGKTLAAASTVADGTCRLFFWDVATGKRIRRVSLDAHVGPGQPYLTALAITLDSKTLLAGTCSGLVRRWELASGKELPALRGHVGGRNISGLHLAPDGRTLVSLGHDGMFRRWDLATGRQKSSDDGYAGYLHAIPSPDGRTLAAGDAAGRVELWDADSGKRVRVLRSSGPWVVRLAFAPDGKTLAAALADRVVLWDTRTWREVRSLSPLYSGLEHPFWFVGLTFSPDGKSLFGVLQDGTRLWDLATGKEVWKNRKGYSVAAFAPDGKTLVLGDGSPRLIFLDAATGEERFTLETFKEGGGMIIGIAYSPDGRLLVTSHDDGSLHLREPATGRLLRILKAHRERAWEVSFSPDSKWLLSAGSDGSIVLHDVLTGRQALWLEGHAGRALHVRFLPDGRRALSASWDQTALLWSLRPAEVLRLKGNEETVWKRLRSEQGYSAYGATWALLDDPAAAVAYLRRRLSPAPPLREAETVKRLIADLDATRYRTREAAAKALVDLGPAVAPMLREALPRAKSPEHRLRLERLLAQLQRNPTPDDWRVIRAVQAAELCRTPEARQLLREWAAGAPGVLLTEQAREALARLR